MFQEGSFKNQIYVAPVLLLIMLLIFTGNISQEGKENADPSTKPLQVI